MRDEPVARTFANCITGSYIDVLKALEYLTYAPDHFIWT